MLMHKNRHKLPGKLRCSECSFKVNKSESLIRHVYDVHRKTKRYKCSFCDYGGNFRRELKNHMIKKHNCEVIDITEENDP